uniref:PHD-type domain-containing protein n=1 Tax=Kalanchoe fedtschenkoi TaxID=63787 RepID=A0A7N0VDI0_KALFE
MAESGTCNVCSAPCASCMHFNRLVTGIKTEGSSAEAICGNTSSQHSTNKSVDVNPLKKRSFDNLQDTASVTSNYESVSENIKNKDTVRTYCLSEDVTYPDLSAAGSPGRAHVSRSLASASSVNVSNKCDQKKTEECLEGHDEYSNRVDYTMIDKGNNIENAKKLQNLSIPNNSGVLKLVKGDNSQNPPPTTGPCAELDEGRHSKSDKDRNDSIISYQGGSSFSLVARKLESRELDFDQSNKASPIVSSSDVSVYPRMKTEVKIEKDSNYLPEESLDVVSTSKGTSNDLTKLPVMQQQSLESHSGDESEEIVEHDVNICDICGDAGREDLLATCSGCSDGAEHTYCMYEKMEKVPEGEWFCEECRLADKIRKQRDMVEEAVKGHLYSRSRSLQKNLSVKLDLKESYVEGNRTETYTPATQSRKRQLDKVDSVITPKRQAIEIAKDLTVASTPRRLSRDGSFNSTAQEKVNKSSYLPSHRIHNLSPQPQTDKGPLSKSNSFNALSWKPKGNSMDNMPHKQKGPREPSDAKDGANRLMARSLSLRPANLGRPNAAEPKVIMLSPKSSHGSDMKGFKKLKEPLSFERRKSFRDERTPSMSSSLGSASGTDQKVGSWENGLVSSDYNSKDSKAALSDGKITPLPKLIGHASRRTSDMSEKKLNKTHVKDESASNTAAKHSSNVDAILNPDLPSPREASNPVVKNADSTSRSRLGSLSSNLCQRCKEPITAAHVCVISSPRVSAADSSAGRVAVEDADKVNPVKAALHAAALLKKSVICKKSKSPDPENFDEQPVLMPNSNGGHAPQDLLSGSNYMKNTSSAEKKHIGKSTLHIFGTVSGQESSINSVNKSYFSSKEHFSSNSMIVDSVVTGDGKSNCKTLPTQSFPPMWAAPTSAIPELEYIWQGDFEVNRNGEKVADMHPGFQAHLSTFASPKVMEAVHKFSPKLSLMEIPRVTVWPAQFRETGATEDNIALYFFARDIESYEKHYKILLDKMMRNDVALKGNINGVELLIFPSSQLPQKSQRWNMLFFMWGVFHIKKHNCQSQVAGLIRKPDTHRGSCIIASDASPSIPMTAHPVLDSKQLNSDFVRHSGSGRSSDCAQSCSKWSSTNNFGEEHTRSMDCEVKPKPTLIGAITAGEAMYGNKCMLVDERSVIDGQGISPDNQELCYASQGIDSLGNDENEAKRVKMERKIKNEESDVKPSLKKEPSMKHLPVKEYDCGQANNKTPFNVYLTEIASPVSDGEESKSALASSGSKDLTIGCSTSNDHHTGSRISSQKIMYDLNLDARHFLEESGTAEGFLSAAESPQSIDVLGVSSARWDLNSSANDVQVDGDSKDRQEPEPGLPSLDLSLCADTESFHPRSGALPLFVEMAEPCVGGAERKEDAPAASLSLSLAFPGMGENQLKQASMRTDQLNGPIQAKPPFLIFGGLAEK